MQASMRCMHYSRPAMLHHSRPAMLHEGRPPVPVLQGRSRQSRVVLHALGPRSAMDHSISAEAPQMDVLRTVSISSPSSNHGDAIYSQPELYELAFSYRDIKSEVKFLREVHKLHGSGGSLQSVLDLGSGPGNHALGLAASGVGHVVGLEANPSMLQHAQAKAKAHSTEPGKQVKGTVQFVSGDMTRLADLKLPTSSAGSGGNGSGGGGFGAGSKASSKQQGSISAGQFDMVTCLLGTFTHLLTNKQARAAFRGISSVLKPHGLFVLELAHPGDLFDGTLIISPDAGKEMWEVPHGKGKLLVEWGADLDQFDSVTQVVERTVSMNLFDDKEAILQSIEEMVPARQYTCQEIDLLAEGAGLSIVQMYGDLSTGIDLYHEDSYRLVMVLEKHAL